MNDLPEKSDERRATRARLVAVYNRLLLDQDQARPKVADLIGEAGVARSTFYDHFDGIAALHDESLSIVLGKLAQALTPPADRPALGDLLDHVWENRTRARAMLTGEAGERAEALLARLLERQLGERADRRLHAILVSGMAMAAMAGWLQGRMVASPQHLAERLASSATAIIDPIA